MSIDEEITMIVRTIANELGVDDPYKRSKSDKYRNMRGLIAYVIIEGFPHLMKRYAHIISLTVPDLYKRAQHAKKVALKNDQLRNVINKIGKDLGVPSIQIHEDIKHESAENNISHTKILFGFDYSQEEVKQRYKAMLNAHNWFNTKYNL